MKVSAHFRVQTGLFWREIFQYIFICWVTLQNRDVPPNAKCSAVHIRNIIPKFYIFKQILILNSILFPTQLL
jgi:hypothetical protein